MLFQCPFVVAKMSHARGFIMDKNIVFRMNTVKQRILDKEWITNKQNSTTFIYIMKLSNYFIIYKIYIGKISSIKLNISNLNQLCFTITYVCGDIHNYFFTLVNLSLFCFRSMWSKSHLDFHFSFTVLFVAHSHSSKFLFIKYCS